MMVTYFITLFLMFVVLVIGGVLGYVFRDQVSFSIRKIIAFSNFGRIFKYTQVQRKEKMFACNSITQLIMSNFLM